MVSCDFCGERAAIVYCRADSAKLCLSCDQHVHSANALSRKHLRSQICDNCGGEPASVRCATDCLVLCQDCDWDAHGSCVVSAAHDRRPIEGFSGCPSALDLASAWGLEIEKETPWLEELMVPYPSDLLLVKNKSCCGKQKQVILKQLLELLGNSGDDDDDGGGDDQQPVEPQQQQQQQQGRGFTSEPNSQCDHTAAQIWDFNLGQLRGHDESGTLELEYGGSDMVYNVKSYREFLKESSLAKIRGFDLSGLNCSIAHENIIPFNSVSNNQAPSQGPATSESNNVPVSKLPSCSGSSKPKCFGGSKDLQLMDQSILIKSESVAAITQADMELLAKNRGNAMQRYKEKKKTRRYDKHIRYESRKARADTRKRVKGRFVKASEAPAG